MSLVLDWVDGSMVSPVPAGWGGVVTEVHSVLVIDTHWHVLDSVHLGPLLFGVVEVLVGSMGGADVWVLVELSGGLGQSDIVGLTGLELVSGEVSLVELRDELEELVVLEGQDLGGGGNGKDGGGESFHFKYYY